MSMSPHLPDLLPAPDSYGRSSPFTTITSTGAHHHIQHQHQHQQHYQHEPSMMMGATHLDPIPASQWPHPPSACGSVGPGHTTLIDEHHYGAPPTFASAGTPTSTGDICMDTATIDDVVISGAGGHTCPSSGMRHEHEHPSSMSSASSTAGVPDKDDAVRAFIELLNDDDEIVVRDVSVVAIEWSMKPEGREAIASSPQFVQTLLKCLSRQELDRTIIHCAAGVLHNISQMPSGQSAILNAGGVPVLIETLSSSIESAVVFAITSLHNLLLQLDATKAQVKAHRGLRPIVDLLRRKVCDNPRFFAIVADCIRHLAYKDPESQLIIYQEKGSGLLLSALEKCLNEPEDLHPITTLSRALRALSTCRNNKEQIVCEGGMQILSMCLELTNAEVQNICVCTLRNLSDVANREKCLDQVLWRLIELMKKCSNGYQSQEPIVEYALGTLFNLTCNNEANKLTIVRNQGLETLVQTIKIWDRSLSIIELAVSLMERLTSRRMEEARRYLLMSDAIPTLSILHNQLEHGHLAPQQLWRQPDQGQYQTWSLLKAKVEKLVHSMRNHHLQ